MAESTNSAVTKSPHSSPRATWLDAVRGLAVLGMLETHTVNALLAPAWRDGPVFGWMTFFSGLVAPAFLWIAGYAHGLGWQRRQAAGQTACPRKTLRRLAVVGLIGYAMHLPLAGTAAAWRQFFSIDVLQCLSGSLLLVVGVEQVLIFFSDRTGNRFREHRAWSTDQAAVVGVPPAGGIDPQAKPRRRSAGHAAILAGAAVLVVAAGLIAVPSTGFWPLDAWFDQSGASLFPLIPWTAFVLIGALMSTGTAPLWVWVAVGIAGMLTPQPYPFVKSHPAFFAERLGYLLVLVAVIRGLEKWVTFPKWLLLAGRESLVIYIGHIAILYLLPVRSWLGTALSPASTALAAIGLALMSIGLAWLAQRWKRRSPSTHVA